MPIASTQAPHVALPFGRFYGHTAVERRAPGLAWSMMRADPHRVVTRHSHDEAHFVLVLDGLYVSSAHGAPAVSDGLQLIYNPPGTTHRDRFEARARRIGGRFLTLSVTDAWLAETSRARGAQFPMHATVLTAASTLHTATRLAAACSALGSDADFDQHALALSLLDLLGEEASASETPTANAPSWLLRAREYLDDSIGGEVSMSDVAQVAGVHPVHVARVFRQHLGVSPSAYVRRRRIEQAQALLRHTQRSLADIALACGFGDQSHFSHAFRRACGVTASAYRNGWQHAEMETLITGFDRR